MSSRKPHKSADRSNEPTNVSRRNLLKTGAVVGVGGTLSAIGVSAQDATPQLGAAEVTWADEADVVIIGAGASGIVAAIEAVDAGSSVLVVEAHFDVGGRMIYSTGTVELGGGHSLQQRYGIEDSADQVFEDWVTPHNSLSPRNDRELVRAWADENAATFEFLVENGWQVNDESEPGIAVAGDGDPRIRRRTSTHEWAVPEEVVIPGQVGSGLARPLERSARDKGVQFLLSHRMTELIVDDSVDGRVVGVTAHEVDEWFEPTGAEPINIRAGKAVIIATGGSAGDVNFRRIIDPRLTEEYYSSGNQLVLRAADGHRAAMKHGASAWGQGLNLLEAEDHVMRHSLMGAEGVYGAGFPPDSPVFFRARATGLNIADRQNTILVKEHGRRFMDETARLEGFDLMNELMAWTGNPDKLNGGGPIWAIFDADAVEREGWDIEPPSVDPDYFFSGDTLEELAANIVNPHQSFPMPADALVETVERYNSFVDSGVDEDFDKPIPQYKIETPPFYAGWNTPMLHGTHNGLRTNTSCQVLTMDGEIIPSLYATGEAAGGFTLHGFGRVFVFGRIAGIHAASLESV